MKDDIIIGTILRNFKSDTDYLNCGDFWIEKIKEDDRINLCKDLSCFHNYPCDNYILARWDHVGRGESGDFLSRRSRVFWLPLFQIMKLFKRGDLIMPFGFAHFNDRWREVQIYGEHSYGYGWDKNPYVLNQAEIDKFNVFRKEISSYLKFLNYTFSPFHKKIKSFEDIDNRCQLAIYLLLKESIEAHSHFFIIDRLIEYTIAFESLYLLDEKQKRKLLSPRVAALLGKDEDDNNKICEFIEKLYVIRNNIVHGSLIDYEEDKYLEKNIYVYENYLRKSILAFLDLNLHDKSKRQIFRIIKKAIDSAEFRNELQESLKLLQLAC